MVSDGSVQAEVSLQSSLRRSPRGILFVQDCSYCGPLPSASLIDFIRSSFFHASPPPHLPWPGESGEGLDGLAPMVRQTSKPKFTSFQDILAQIVSQACIAHSWHQVSKTSSSKPPLISTTFMFNVRHHLWKLTKT